MSEEYIYTFDIKFALEEVAEANPKIRKQIEKKKKEILERAKRIIIDSEYYYEKMQSDVERAVREAVYGEY